MWSLVCEHISWSVTVRLSVETERSASYVSEVSRLKEQVTSRDRAVMDVNNQLELLRQEFTRLSDSYQQQTQLTRHATYDLLTNYCIFLYENLADSWLLFGFIFHLFWKRFLWELAALVLQTGYSSC